LRPALFDLRLGAPDLVSPREPVAYGLDAASVLSLLTAAALKTEGVSAEPRAPVALLTGYGDSSLDFVLRVWTNDIGNWMNIRSAILTTVLVDLDAAGISLPYPQRHVHVKTLPAHVDRSLNQPRDT
jgi:potassium-dependent mechanosensitive channel